MDLIKALVCVCLGNLGMELDLIHTTRQLAADRPNTTWKRVGIPPEPSSKGIEKIKIGTTKSLLIISARFEM